MAGNFQSFPYQSPVFSWMQRNKKAPQLLMLLRNHIHEKTVCTNNMLNDIKTKCSVAEKNLFGSCSPGQSTWRLVFLLIDIPKPPSLSFTCYIFSASTFLFLCRYVPNTGSCMKMGKWWKIRRWKKQTEIIGRIKHLFRHFSSVQWGFKKVGSYMEFEKQEAFSRKLSHTITHNQCNII